MQEAPDPDQPRLSRQPRRPGPVPNGCGGIASRGWPPAFTGETKGARGGNERDEAVASSCLNRLQDMNPCHAEYDKT